MAETPKLIELTDITELWWRQCANSADFWDEEKGQPSDQMFRWNAADAGKPSGARSTKSSAAQAYEHRTEVERKESRGTWGVRNEVVIELELSLQDDSGLRPPPPASPPGHTYLDVTGVTTAETKAAKRERQRIRTRLLLAANELGRVHPPIPSVPAVKPPDSAPAEATLDE